MKNPVMSNNAFVKGVGDRMGSKMGDRPSVPAEMKHFDAYMSNNGKTSRAAANKVAGSLEDAFPLNKNLTVD